MWKYNSIFNFLEFKSLGKEKKKKNTQADTCWGSKFLLLFKAGKIVIHDRIFNTLRVVKTWSNTENRRGLSKIHNIGGYLVQRNPKTWIGAVNGALRQPEQARQA